MNSLGRLFSIFFGLLLSGCGGGLPPSWFSSEIQEVTLSEGKMLTSDDSVLQTPQLKAVGKDSAVCVSIVDNDPSAANSPERALRALHGASLAGYILLPGDMKVPLSSFGPDWQNVDIEADATSISVCLKPQLALRAGQRIHAVALASSKNVEVDKVYWSSTNLEEKFESARK